MERCPVIKIRRIVPDMRLMFYGITTQEYNRYSDFFGPWTIVDPAVVHDFR